MRQASRPTASSARAAARLLAVLIVVAGLLSPTSALAGNDIKHKVATASDDLAQASLEGGGAQARPGSRWGRVCGVCRGRRRATATR